MVKKSTTEKKKTSNSSNYKTPQGQTTRVSSPKKVRHNRRSSPKDIEIPPLRLTPSAAFPLEEGEVCEFKHSKNKSKGSGSSKKR